MPKSIETRLNELSKRLGACACDSVTRIFLSTDPASKTTPQCEVCGRDLPLVVVQDPYDTHSGVGCG
jgi:hypothetical protein